VKIFKRFVVVISRMECLLGALVALCVLDGIITQFLVTNGYGREGNPILKGLVGDWKFLVIKVLGGLLCALILWDIYKRWPKLAVISTACLVVLLAGIVIWNLYAYSVST
jgi:hypothetical protein